VVDGVMSAMTSARQNEIKAWEQEITPCEHTLCLDQQSAKELESQCRSNSRFRSQANK
jgi:ubiquitin carboxyl-terminal hydrolase 5/13